MTESTWWKCWAMAATAPMVVGYRVTQMAAAGWNPRARDRREFDRMGQEKVEATLESVAAATRAITQVNLQLWQLGMQVAAGGTIPVTAGTQMAGAWANVLEKGIAPVHRRVVANERRLRRQTLRS